MGEVRDVAALIDAAFTGRTLTNTEVQQMAEHIAAVGFDPNTRVRAGRRLIDVEWQGRKLAAGSRLSSADAHYLRHIMTGREWPDGTTTAQYQASATAIARDERSGVFISTLQEKRRSVLLVKPERRAARRASNGL